MVGRRKPSETVMPDLDALLRELIRVQPNLHRAGTFDHDVLREIAKHAAGRQFTRSVETGCGATTLLLSHLSAHHTVFSLDLGNSMGGVIDSSLLAPNRVEFIVGPTQRTLPQHRFADTFQFALIDGPHAYPFPDLEYYFLYPHLEAGRYSWWTTFRSKVSTICSVFFAMSACSS